MEDYQKCSVLYCVPRLYAVIYAHIWAVLRVVVLCFFALFSHLESDCLFSVSYVFSVSLFSHFFTLVVNSSASDCLERLIFVTFYISALEILLLTYLLIYLSSRWHIMCRAGRKSLLIHWAPLHSGCELLPTAFSQLLSHVSRTTCQLMWCLWLVHIPPATENMSLFEVIFHISWTLTSLPGY